MTAVVPDTQTVNTNTVPIASTTGLYDLAGSQGSGSVVAGTESIVIVGAVLLIIVLLVVFAVV